MKPHIKIYLEYFGYDTEDPFVLCEVCGQKGQDIHHIKARGMGGTKTKDHIKNLMCLCRRCHILYGDKKQYMDYLTNLHQKMLSISLNK